MYRQEDESIEKQLDDIARYFASKWPWQIDFADADTEEYNIFMLEQKWRAVRGDTFGETFPYMDSLWDILCDWNVGETRTIAEREKIIELAKRHLEQKT